MTGILSHRDAAALPVASVAPAVNASLRENPCLVVTAPPGAGKSTLLPLTLLEAFPQGKILMLEPRRLAARCVAGRMAYLLGETVGETVGYRIRFEQRISGRTRIEVLTEGILTRMLTEDPALEGVGIVVFDEFHERSLVTDTALALVRASRSLLRPDLRVVVLSATLDAGPVCQALSAPLIESEGRQFPVRIRHGDTECDARNVSSVVARAVLQAHREEDGDILAFLPGEGEIRQTAQLLGDALGDTRICPLYGMLSAAEQDAALAPSPPGGRKVVLATPVAETSLTIEGGRTVVDSGLCRQPVFDPQRGLTRLETVRISLDRAAQRTGRAGRLGPGVCYRLWSMAAERRMAPQRKPEILEADLSEMVLGAAAWGEPCPERLPWLTPPPLPGLRSARETLTAVGALDDQGRITPLGRAMAAFPCHPRLAGMLLRADSPVRKSLAADLAAILSERDPLPGETESGLDLRVNALRRHRGGWPRLAHSAAQFRKMVRAQQDDAPADPFEIGALCAAAYPERIGKALQAGSGTFQLAAGGEAVLPGGDTLTGAAWLVAASLHDRADGAGKIFLAAPVDVHDLEPFVREKDAVFWDRNAGAVAARRERRIGALLVESKPLPEEMRAAVSRVICAAAPKEGRTMFDFSDEVTTLQRRIAVAAAWHPELSFPDVGTDTLLARAADWLPPVIGRASSVAELRKIDLAPVIYGFLSYSQQQALERIAPSHVTVPTGSRIRVEYGAPEAAPVVRVRLQECFGLERTPCVDEGRRPVLMDLLSPGFKSVQRTADLPSFWSEAYFEVRKELRRRYPKHAWPEDPLHAEPVRGVKKKSIR